MPPPPPPRLNPPSSATESRSRRSSARQDTHLRIVLPHAAGLWLACALAALSGCGQNVEFRPYGADRFQQKSVLALNPTVILPMQEDVLRQAQARVQEALTDSPYLGRVILPAELRELVAQDAIAGSAYDTLSDFVTVLGIADRELVLSVSEKHPVDLLFSLQVLNLACPNCEVDDKVGLVAVILDARTAEVLWRLHLTEPVSRDANAAEVKEEAEHLTDDFLSMFDYLLKPKWHRQRFEHLRPTPAPQG